jgi:hypothetical protein
MIFRLFLLPAIALGLVLAVSPTGARAQEDQPVGVVEQPDSVTTAPSDEGASERAAQGFDTPYSSESNDGAADNLQPQPFSATPND